MELFLRAPKIGLFWTTCICSSINLNMTNLLATKQNGGKNHFEIFKVFFLRFLVCSSKQSQLLAWRFGFLTILFGCIDRFDSSRNKRPTAFTLPFSAFACLQVIYENRTDLICSRLVQNFTGVKFFFSSEASQPWKLFSYPPNKYFETKENINLENYALHDQNWTFIYR